MNNKCQENRHVHSIMIILPSTISILSVGSTQFVVLVRPVFFFSLIFMMILFFILRTTLAIHEYVHTRIGDVHCCCCCCNCTHTHNALHWINIFVAVFRFSFFLSFSYFGWLCVIKKSRMRVFASPIDVSPREWMNGAPIIRNLQMTVLNYEAIDVQLHIYIDLLIYIKLCGQLMGC